MAKHFCAIRFSFRHYIATIHRSKHKGDEEKNRVNYHVIHCREYRRPTVYFINANSTRLHYTSVSVLFGAVCSTSREESCKRRMHMGYWGRVPRYDRIRSRHIEWSTHRGAKGLVRVNDLINKYADGNVISV